MMIARRFAADAARALSLFVLAVGPVDAGGETFELRIASGCTNP